MRFKKILRSPTSTNRSNSHRSDGCSILAAIFFACRMTAPRSCCSACSNAFLAMTFSALDHFRLRIVV